MNCLLKIGLSSNPVSKAKSATLAEPGLRRAEAALRRLCEGS